MSESGGEQEAWEPGTASESEEQSDGGGTAGSRQSYRRARENSAGSGPPAPDFQAFLAGLYTQTIMSLGEIENPATGEKQSDMSQAQYLIDTIGMLKEKTEGNLEQQERQYLMSLLQDLRMRYVRAVDAAAEETAEGEVDREETQQ